MLFRSQASFISELDAWRLANLGTASAEGTAADDANPSGDGITNLEKFAFGLDPGVASRRRVEISGSTLVARGLPVVSQGWQGDAERRVLRFVRRTGNAAEGIVYVPQFSADLAGWADATDAPLVVAGDADFEVVEVPFPASIAGADAAFARVNVAVKR